MIKHSFLNHLTLLQFEGEDSLTFLQGQLSQDMKAVTGHTALLASYANPKGRVLSTLLFWQASPTCYYALLRQDVADFIQKRLSMFVLRAKVKISTVPHQLIAYWGEDLSPLTSLSSTIQTFIDTPSVALHQQPSFTVIALNTQRYAIQFPTIDTTQRLLVVDLDVETSPTLIGEAGSRAEWEKQDIQVVLPWIGEATKGEFVAQSINQDAIGAINFKKGCYPGQEVIARSHYLGNLKRRTLPAVIDVVTEDTAALLGTDVMVEDTPVGQVVNAVSVDGKTYLLLELQLRSTENPTQLTLAQFNSSSPLTLLDVPYSLDKPE
ncbi:YgfZ/GcvT domain-containing protein [Pelistega ratti]|uniref:CAF17-like 4Fe-4S cluster assembly/insertion protein YgfZ n=1 Tax=Pelistega ratti TaxID=2652177 RepID=UPI00135B2EED|nr:hypothetical protein [Pelistega ratti]